MLTSLNLRSTHAAYISNVSSVLRVPFRARLSRPLGLCVIGVRPLPSTVAAGDLHEDFVTAALPSPVLPSTGEPRALLFILARDEKEKDERRKQKRYMIRMILEVETVC